MNEKLDYYAYRKSQKHEGIDPTMLDIIKELYRIGTLSDEQYEGYLISFASAYGLHIEKRPKKKGPY